MSKHAHFEADDDYNDSYVAYLDLLGFKSLVKIAEKNPAERTRLREILSLLRDTLCEIPSIGLRVTHFSDCIIFSTERTAAGLLGIFQSIDILTLNLLQHDILVRGGLVGGGAHHGKDFVYGTAVTRAWEIESKCADAPITLVSQEVFDDAKTGGEHFMVWLLEDPPQRYFVHYLRQYAEYRPEPIFEGKQILDRPGRRVIDFICQRLNTDTDRVLDKAKWLQTYWNRTVAVHGVFASIEAGVTERYNSGDPTIGMQRIAGGG